MVYKVVRLVRLKLSELVLSIRILGERSGRSPTTFSPTGYKGQNMLSCFSPFLLAIEFPWSWKQCNKDWWSG